MNVILSLARKDLLQLLRDRGGMFWLLGLPLIFALFFGSLFGGGGGGGGGAGQMRVAVIQETITPEAESFVTRLEDSPSISLQRMPEAAAVDAVRMGKKVAYLRIVRMPAGGFEMFGGGMPEIEIGIDPVRRAEAGFLEGLTREAMFRGFTDVFSDPENARAEARRTLEKIEADDSIPPAQRLILKTFFSAMDTFFADADFGSAEASGGGFGEPGVTMVDVTRPPSEKAKPANAFEISFPQSLMWGVLGAMAAFALTLLRERKEGTLLRLLSAPLSYGQVLGGKALACFIACVAVVTIVLGFGALFLGVGVANLPGLILAVASVGVCFTGLMMVMTTLGRTEQTLSGTIWGVNLTMAMTGGSMIPEIAMPDWLRSVGHISPVRWSILSLEGAIWRDFTTLEIASHCAVLWGIGIVGFLIGRAILARRAL